MVHAKSSIVASLVTTRCTNYVDYYASLMKERKVLYEHERALQYTQTCRKSLRLGCVNPASWLPLAAGVSSRNLAITFSFLHISTFVLSGRSEPLINYHPPYRL